MNNNNNRFRPPSAYQVMMRNSQICTEKYLNDDPNWENGNKRFPPLISVIDGEDWYNYLFADKTVRGYEQSGIYKGSPNGYKIFKNIVAIESDEYSYGLLAMITDKLKLKIIHRKEENGGGVFHKARSLKIPDHFDNVKVISITSESHRTSYGHGIKTYIHILDANGTQVYRIDVDKINNSNRHKNFEFVYDYFYEFYKGNVQVEYNKRENTHQNRQKPYVYATSSVPLIKISGLMGLTKSGRVMELNTNTLKYEDTGRKATNIGCKGAVANIFKHST